MQGAHVPLFIAPNNLKPFISEGLMDGALTPIQYKDGNKRKGVTLSAPL